jgi:hypothetical protein
MEIAEIGDLRILIVGEGVADGFASALVPAA